MVLAHLVIQLETVGMRHIILWPFTVMGGMGVLLFFFVSGYGLHKGYCTRKMDVRFWQNRMLNMYLSAVSILLVLSLVDIVISCNFNLADVIIFSLLGAWFVDMILLRYSIFLFRVKLQKKKQEFGYHWFYDKCYGSACVYGERI